MKFRLRTLLIVLALGPPVLAGAWYAWRNAAAPKAAIGPSMSYCITADCSELPADDKSLEKWLRAYPNVQVIGVNRKGKSIEVIWGTSGKFAEQLGDSPVSDLRLELDRLGYKGLTRFELN